MKCLACGAEMRLMDVQTDTTTVCGIERHTFRCSTCPQTAQRLMFNRPRMPIIHLPVVTRPKAIDLQMGRPAARSEWVNAVEKLNSKQAAGVARSQRGGLWNSSFADGVHDRAGICARYLLSSWIEVMPRTDLMHSARP